MAVTTSDRTGRSRITWRLLVGVAALWVLVSYVLFAWPGRFSLAAVAAACGVAAPDVRTAPAVADVRAFVEGCGSAGLAAYRDLQIVDLVYPAVNAVLIALVILLLVRQLPHRLSWLVVLPLVAALGDYVENVAAWTLIARGTDTSTWAEQLFQVASAVKVAATTAAWIAVLVLALWVVVRALARRRASAVTSASG